jgi:hypothetical protein
MARWLQPSIRLASAYILALPKRHYPLRVFCAIPYAMALKTLTLAVGNPAIFGETPVKLTRAETLRTALTARSIAPVNFLLGPWFRLLQRDLDAKLPAGD